MEYYLETSAQVEVDIEVVECLPRPENLDVSLRYVLKHATWRGNNIFQLFDPNEEGDVVKMHTSRIHLLHWTKPKSVRRVSTEARELNAIGVVG